jgi:hypothetical protein
MPFILLNWALSNHKVKQAIRETVNVDRDERVSLGDVTGVEALLRRLVDIPQFGSQGRSLELAIRSLEGNTVDESMLRSAYQRSSLKALRSLAQARGFVDPFLAFP